MQAMSLLLAIAQFDATVGDLAANRRAIVDHAARAHAAGAQLLLTPELALTGYPPEDLLLRPAFMQACAAELAALALELRAFAGLAVVVGHPHAPHGEGDRRTASTQQPLRWNAASLLRDGRVEATYGKLELPNYQVFDERRYFTSAGAPLVFEAGGVRWASTCARTPGTRKRRGARARPAPSCCWCSTPRRSTSARPMRARRSWRSAAARPAWRWRSSTA